MRYQVQAHSPLEERGAGSMSRRHIPVRGHEDSAHHRAARECVHTSSARMLNFRVPNDHHVATSPQKTPVLADQCVYAHPRAALQNSGEVQSFSRAHSSDTFPPKDLNKSYVALPSFVCTVDNRQYWTWCQTYYLFGDTAVG